MDSNQTLQLATRQSQSASLVFESQRPQHKDMAQPFLKLWINIQDAVQSSQYVLVFLD